MKLQELEMGGTDGITLKVPNPKSKTVHGSTHTHGSPNKVSDLLRNARAKGDPTQVHRTLKSIESLRQAGRF